MRLVGGTRVVMHATFILTQNYVNVAPSMLILFARDAVAKDCRYNADAVRGSGNCCCSQVSAFSPWL